MCIENLLTFHEIYASINLDNAKYVGNACLVNLLAQPSKVWILLSPSAFLYRKVFFEILMFADGEKRMERLFYEEGLHFSCQQCSSCCRYDPGFVFLSKKDADILADALKMTYNDFIESYCRWIPVGDGLEKLSLRELSNYDCIFWKNGGCTVYPSRPLQCRTFPFWQSILHSEAAWNGTKESCPGMGKGDYHSRDEIQVRLAERESEPIIERMIR